MIKIIAVLDIIFLALSLIGASAQDTPPRPMNQYPSPMADAIRAHVRIEEQDVPGVTFILKNGLPEPIEVYFSDSTTNSLQMDLLFHFHGLSYVPQYAVHHSGHPFILAVVNLGSGSAVYENPFENQTTFPELIAMLQDSVMARKSKEVNISRIFLSSFSAGYGAVRAILRNHLELVDGIILLDGLHTDYDPAGWVLAQGGKLNEEKLGDFLQFARMAMNGQKRFLMTHSEIFPGTYASTTETADFLINRLELRRNPVLEWGPGGMQLLSKTHQSGLIILGFAGNSAPDHVDHLHGLPVFLKMILDE